jgi:hypothetical protein
MLFLTQYPPLERRIKLMIKFISAYLNLPSSSFLFLPVRWGGNGKVAWNGFSRSPLPVVGMENEGFPTHGTFSCYTFFTPSFQPFSGRQWGV